MARRPARPRSRRRPARRARPWCRCAARRRRAAAPARPRRQAPGPRAAGAAARPRSAGPPRRAGGAPARARPRPGPPPITTSRSGCSARSNTVSLVRYGTPSRPGIGGTAGREPVASTKRRARMTRVARRHGPRIDGDGTAHLWTRFLLLTAPSAATRRSGRTASCCHGSRPAVPAERGPRRACRTSSDGRSRSIAEHPDRLVVIGGGNAGDRARRRAGGWRRRSLIEGARLPPRPSYHEVERRCCATASSCAPAPRSRASRRTARDRGRAGRRPPETVRRATSSSQQAAGRPPRERGARRPGWGATTNGVVVDQALRTPTRHVYAIKQCASSAAGPYRSATPGTAARPRHPPGALFRLPYQLDPGASRRMTYAIRSAASAWTRPRRARCTAASRCCTRPASRGTTEPRRRRAQGGEGRG